MKITFSIVLIALISCITGCSEANKSSGNPTIGTQPLILQSQSNKPASAAGTNPAHGAPGHRCDIPVGAPLNSPAQPSLTTPATTPSSTQAVAPGTNPPHGQPGHDCSIAVGAPLNK